MSSQPHHIRSDGTFDIDRIGLKVHWKRDLYHFLLTSSWRLFISSMTLVYLGSNLLFALLYSLDSTGIVNAKNFADIYFFAIQTMSTVGYGAMSPQSTYTHLIMTLQSVFSFTFTAVSTGLVFAKFSRIRARVLFSQNALIHVQDGQRVLTFRTANERNSQILDAEVHVTFSQTETTLEGIPIRRFYPLKLIRDNSPLFALVWNVYHTIDESSPLWGLAAVDLITRQATLMITLSGMDHDATQALHTRYAYNAEDILFDQRFADIIGQYENGKRFVDYRLFHEHVPTHD